MPLRIPPGRSGRLWLVGRLALAARAAEVIEQKRAVLATELEQAAAAEVLASGRLGDAAAEADRWLRRAVIPAGGRTIDLLAAHVRRRAEVEVSWRSVMGVELPERVTVQPGQLPDPVGLGADAATVFAAYKHASALEAAVEHATAAAKRRRIERELRETMRRGRAIKTRWIPRQEAALQDLELRLDEGEREESARLRWLRNRGGNARGRR